MKKTLKKLVISALAVIMTATCSLAVGCGETKNSDKDAYVVGICQLVQHTALDAATQGFMDALKEEVEKAGKTVTFDLQNAQGDTTTCTTIANSLVSKNVDLILANATQALQAVYNATEEIPILGTSVTEYGVALGIENFNGTVGSNVSGTSDLADLEDQADMILELVPNATKVGLLYCSAEANSKYQVDVVKAYLEGKGLTCTYYSFSERNDITTVANQAANNCDVIYVPTDNTVADCAEIVNSVCDDKVPVIAGEEGICKGCGIATLSISYYDLGVATGKMAAKILLEDADIATMPIEYAANPTYKYNPAMCEKFGITPPANYVALEIA